tara:strand:- start:80 stop:307 length:228 start_codon:yes stop_codon:yes gene_type:complete
MIEIYRTDTSKTPYYSDPFMVWIMVDQIIHFRDCGEGLTEIVVRSHQYVENYYTVTPFKKIKNDIEKQLSRGGRR